MTGQELKDFIIEQLEDMKIEEIISIDSSKISSLADFVIIGNGRSGKHLESSAENLKLKLKEFGVTNGSINGKSQDGWILYDLGNVIVHLFIPEVRDIYKLEELFSPKNKTIVKTSIKEKKSDEKSSVKKIVVKKTIKKVGDKKTNVVKKSTVAKKKIVKK